MGQARKGGSFRLRMIGFSTLLAGIGLLGFTVLALSFYRAELRRSLSLNLRSVLSQAAPALLQLTPENRFSSSGRIAERVLGRLDEFGAVYAVRDREGGWTWNPEWPLQDSSQLDQVANDLFDGSMKKGRWFNENRREDRLREPGRQPVDRNGVELIGSPPLSSGWLYAGVRNSNEVVLLALSEAKMVPQLKRLSFVLLIASPFALGLVALGAWFLSSRAISPIRKLTGVAAEVTASDLSQRISGEGMDKEFRDLIEVFNGMMGRLERSFGQAHRFGQDAAHELNTPLTILTGKVEEAVVNAEVGSEEQIQLVEIADELTHMREIVRKLHLLARIDGGRLRPDFEPVDFTALLQEVVDELGEAFPEITFALQSADSVQIQMDRALVRQILLNLLGNAARYNRPHGKVSVGLARSDDCVCLSVENTGPAIPEELRSILFDRFTRGDASRTNSQGFGGLGLGLSLSREFARVQGGDLILACAEEDRIRFELTLSGKTG